jgi:hypothetical protein
MLGVFLQWAGSLSVTNVLNDLDSLGFFSYILPFLLIFALVYAIISQQNIFKENKGSALIIALAIGLLALQFDIISNFFAILFPNLAKGLGVLIVALILIGAFIPEEGNKLAKSSLFIIGLVILFVVVINSFKTSGYGGYTDFEGWWNTYGAILIVLGILVAAIVAVAVKSGGTTTTTHQRG